MDQTSKKSKRDPQHEARITALNAVYGRQLPHSVESEQALLGALLVDNTAIGDATALLETGDFFLKEHQKIYAAMVRMFADSRAVDPVTLIGDLVKEGAYTEESGASYIRQLAEGVPSISNWKDYARIVHDKAVLRRLIFDCEEIMMDAYSQSATAEEAVRTAEAKIYQLAQGRTTSDFTSIQDILTLFYAELQAIKDNKDNPIAVQTNFADLDRVLVGMNPGDLIIIGGRPGMGKTAFAMNIAAEVAKHRTDKAVAIFSLEMSKTQLAARLLSSEGRVNNHSIRDGNLTEEEIERLSNASAAFYNTHIYIDDTSDMRPLGMLTKLRRIENLGLVVIDYLQLMSSDERKENRNQEVSAISRQLKLIAKELAVPVIACSQLARQPKDAKEREAKEPDMQDLRDSGAIEQDADVVMFLHRKGYYHRDQQELRSDAKCIVAKNRHGEARSVALHWEPEFTKFSSVETRYDNQEPGD